MMIPRARLATTARGEGVPIWHLALTRSLAYGLEGQI
jgi:hypothetical protein